MMLIHSARLPSQGPSRTLHFVPFRLLLLMLVLILLLLATPGLAVQFEIAASGKRCLFDDLTKDTLATGTYEVTDVTNGLSHVQVVVRGPTGEEVFMTENADKGKFAFTAQESGMYESCFHNRDAVAHVVSLQLRSGVEAKDLSEVAQRWHLKPLETQLLRLQQVMDEVRAELLQLKVQEQEMRDMNELTNDRVKWFSLFTVFVVLTLGVAQIVYLQRYMSKKKII